MKTPLPLVAIIGRPNVGKSTLFNRIVGRRQAIVDDLPGVTRDRLSAECSFRDLDFRLMDTGGLDLTADDGITGLVKKQSQIAMQEADAIIFLVDGRAGLTPMDVEIMEYVRGTPKPLFVAVNKIDVPERESLVADFYPLGVDRLYPVSSEHGIGVDDLLEEIYPLLERRPHLDDIAEPDIPHIAVIGRPNVGKSTLINTIVGKERLVVSDQPGTTRDSIDTLATFKKTPYRFIDTAGIRRRGKIDPRVERYSVVRAMRSLGRADLGLLLLDAVEGPTEQDTKIAGLALRMGRACLLMVNKWDLRRDDARAKERYVVDLKRRMPFLSWASFFFGSARSPRIVPRVFACIDEAMKGFSTRVPTGRLNKTFQDILDRTPPPAGSGGGPGGAYITQVAIRPPTFVLFVNNPKVFGGSYLRFLENRFRKEWGFHGSPVRILIRAKGGKR